MKSAVDKLDARKRARAKEAFLITYRATANVSEAARAAHIARQTAHNWRRDDPVFAADWDEAQEVAIDALEEAARRRALDSSDTLMIFLLKANRPEKYRERLTIDTVKRFEDMSDEALNDFIARRLIGADAAGADSPGDAAARAAGSNGEDGGAGFGAGPLLPADADG